MNTSETNQQNIIDVLNRVDDKLDAMRCDIYAKFDNLDKKYPSMSDFRVIQIICFSIVGSIALAFLEDLIRKNMGANSSAFIPIITPIAKAIGTTVNGL